MSESSNVLEEMVCEYFKGVDTHDLECIFGTLAEDCVFTVETHQIRLQGREQITQMFLRLWESHRSVQHSQFSFITDTNLGRVAVQFKVTNRLHDGSLVFKSNCNFFVMKDGFFNSVNVYMAGANTLDIPS